MINISIIQTISILHIKISFLCKKNNLYSSSNSAKLLWILINSALSKNNKIPQKAR